MATKVFIYIDETGDRGTGGQTSPIFGMAALIVGEQTGLQLQAAVAQLRLELEVPSGVVMSWKKHTKTHDRRRRAAEVLGAVDDLKVCYLYAAKSELQAGSYRDDNVRFYNYVAYRTYKSALWAARNIHGTDAEVHFRFGHVRNFDHSGTDTYIRSMASTDPRIPDAMVKSLRWVSADRYLESQAADLFGGFLKSAIWPSGPFGYVEPSYLLSVWQRIRNSDACAIPLGIMSMPSNDVLTRETWFPCKHCKK